MTNLLLNTTRALEHLTLSIISLNDAAVARDFFRTEDVRVDVQVAVSGSILPGEQFEPGAAIHAAQTLQDASQDPELVLQALVQQNVRQVLEAIENFHKTAVADMMEISGANEALAESRRKAVRDILSRARTGV